MMIVVGTGIRGWITQRVSKQPFYNVNEELREGVGQIETQ